MEPLGTVTFLFTDIEGSTGLVRKLRDAYPELLAIHHRLIRDAVRLHGGEEVDNQGDAFFFTFPRAGNAIEAAADAQRFLAAQPWPGDSVVRVRMGIHTGEPGRTATGYHGIGVVRAARISAAGHGGQVLLSAVTHSLVEDDELPGISFRDLGEHRLKDLERAQHLWQLDVAGLPSAFPPPRGIEEQTIKEQFVEPRRHRPHRVPAGTAVLALTIAAVAGYLLTRGGGGVTVVGNSIASIDPATNRIVSDVRVGQQPGRIAIGYGGVWVLNSGDHTVSHVDPAKNRLAATIPLPATPTDIAVGGGTVWVVAYGGTLAEIDPSADSVRRTFRFGRGQSQGAGAEAAFGYGAVWIASPGFQVIRVDSHSRSHRLVTGSEASAFDQAAVAVGSGKVWASFAENDQVLKVDPTRRRVVDSTRLPRGGTSHELAAGSGHVWATASDPSTLFELSAGDLSLEHVTNVGATPTGVAVGAGSVWVVNQGDGTVSRVAIDSGRVTRTIHVGGAPNSVAVSAGRVWVSVD